MIVSVSVVVVADNAVVVVFVDVDDVDLRERVNLSSHEDFLFSSFVVDALGLLLETDARFRGKSGASEEISDVVALFFMLYRFYFLNVS